MQQVPAAYKDACSAYERRKFDIALQKLDETLAENQNFAPAFYIKGLAHMQLRNWKEAFTNFKHYSQFAPEKGDTYLNMGTALLNMGLPKEALPYLDFSLSLKMTENRPERVHLNKALAYRKLNDFENVEKSLEEALKLHPYFDLALLEMAKVKLDSHKFEEAKTYYQRIIDLPKQHKDFPLWEVHVGLALALIALKQYSQALISIEDAVELQPHAVDFFKTHEMLDDLRNSEYADDLNTILGV